ncbi:hypothetical protein [Pedobacter frigoris]|uniref:DUF1574 domain-containing protein n=1 Tax=Pedobacter frigoris TaxID=2571272 RepID=A0A4U1CE47_9SPHI|nr:hypothetical protein [Pedobacter frigoris]TKC05274.1 hypothetical protein FA047_16080 [Pedobacter frigoris]
MGRFILRLLLFSIVLIVFLAPLFFFRIGGERLKYIDNPVAAIIDKHERIKKINSPRLIITGGSNAFYGINSAKLRDSLNLDVCNMALFAGFGLDFMLNELKDELKSNDIVLLSIEYFLPSRINPKAEEQLIRYYPNSIKYLNKDISTKEKLLNPIKLNIESVQNFVLKPLTSKSSIFIQTRLTNEYGDAIGNLNFKNPAHSDFAVKFEYKDWEGIAKLNQFLEIAALKNVKVLFVFPPIPEVTYNINKDIIARLEADLKSRLKIQVLCTPQDMVFDDNLFFDTEYHLNKFGRELRTNKLIEMIKDFQMSLL